MRIIGLTGGIASGKSSVARILEKLGAPVIDADILAREVVKPGKPAYGAIVTEFGDGILCSDRSINRKKLGQVVFADAEKLRILEGITHPAIRLEAERKLAKLRGAGARVVFYMAPLLIEAGAVSRVDEIWVVFTDRQTQIKRVVERDGLTLEEALQRISAQMPMEEKARLGSLVIDNRGTPEETEKLVQEIWAREIGTAVNGKK